MCSFLAAIARGHVNLQNQAAEDDCLPLTIILRCATLSRFDDEKPEPVHR
jgi:hypothetical protein